MIVALDPGGTTGVAWTEDCRQIITTEIKGEHHHVNLYEVLNALDPVIVIYEIYDRREKAALLTPMEYIGVARLWAMKNQKAIAAQRPSDVKLQWPNDKLDKLGLRRKSPHENDAIRHLLWYITNKKKDDYFLRRMFRLDNDSGRSDING